MSTGTDSSRDSARDCVAFSCGKGHLGHVVHFASFVLLLASVACGGDPRLSLPTSPTSTTLATAVPASAPAATPYLAAPLIGDVVWTTSVDPTSGAPAGTVTAYPSDAPQIIAVVPAAALPPGATIEADWSYNDTSLDAFSTTLPSEGSVTERWVALHLQRNTSAPWPVGTYEVTISLDGSVVRQSSIDVTDAH